MLVEFQEVLWQQEDACLTLVLNRPDSLNSLTKTMRRELLEALSAADRESTVRVVVVRAQGRAFCVGQDLKELQEFYSQNGHHIGPLVDVEYIPIVKALRKLSKPTIAVVEGAAVGGGMALALACDFRIISAKAQLVPGFVNVGLAPDSGTTFLLARSVGYARALSICLLGQPLKAPELVALGLSEAIAMTPEDVQTQMNQLVGQLAQGPTRAYHEIRRLFDESAHLPLDDVLRKESEVQEALSQTQDHRGAIEAFLAKKTPAFVGH